MRVAPLQSAWPMGLCALLALLARPLAAQLLPDGQRLTPTAAPGARFTMLNPHLKDAPGYVAGQPISEALSPDRGTLLVLTSGYNRRTDARGQIIAQDSKEYVFVFDVSGGDARRRQVLEIANTYVGITFAPDGRRFVVSGGGDDELHVFDRGARGWAESSGSPIPLHHATGIGIAQKPLAEGVDVSPDGALAVITNRYNASVSVVDLPGKRLVREIDLRPGKLDAQQAGTPGGEYPDAVRFVARRELYVASARDRELIALDLDAGRVIRRIPLDGNPTKMVASRDGARLYVALDNADAVAVIDTRRGQLLQEISAVAPAGVLKLAKRYRGASPNGLALAEDERTLFVTDRGTNALAVIDLDGKRVAGLIPTGWSPSDVVVGAHGMLYVVNTQSLPGPNPGNCLGYQTVPCPVKDSPVLFAPNEYILSLMKGGLLSLPIPRGAALAALTRKVAANDHFEPLPVDTGVIEAVRQHVRHVIYIVKENRTYDQLLGDLPGGDGDARLAEFPRTTTPNQHALAEQFVLLDAFFDSGNVSGNGWPWSTAARESDAGAKMLPVDYAERGGSYDWEGTNSNVNVGLTGAARLAADPLGADPASGQQDPDVLPGTANVAAPDGPEGEAQQGYLWSAALRAGLSVRNYGFMIDLTRYRLARRDAAATASAYIPREHDPAARKLIVAYAADPQLASLTDGYFRGFDEAFPDTWREREWEREFTRYEVTGDLPALLLVRLMSDHTGAYAAAIDGVNTPERQVADNDYALGRLVERVAHSSYAKDTLIFVVEDDAQDGPDHVDAHRSVAFIAGPCVRRAAHITRHYTTVNLLRTITDVLGIDHLGLFDATQAPMTEALDPACPAWSFRARVSGLLKASDVTLPIPPDTPAAGPVRSPRHPMAYWARRTRGLDFDAEDRVDALAYNRLLWSGLMAPRPYPARRTLGSGSSP